MEVAVIKDKRQEQDLKDYLKETDMRAYIFYLISSQAGYRGEDILPLRVRDVKGRDYFDIREKKTGNQRKIKFTSEVSRELNRYIRGKKDYMVLFPSRNGSNKPLDYTTMYKKLRDAGIEIGIPNVGTHTGRKTYGYRLFVTTKSIADVQLMFGHKNPEHTRRYIGADQDFRDSIMMKAFT